MKTNSVNPRYSYAGGNSPPRLGARKGHGNSDGSHSNRKPSTRYSPSSRAGLQGLSVGAKVPMKMFQQDYKGKNLKGAQDVTQGMATHIPATRVKKKVKLAARKSNRFMGLGGAGSTL